MVSETTRGALGVDMMPHLSTIAALASWGIMNIDKQNELAITKLRELRV